MMSGGWGVGIGQVMGEGWSGMNKLDLNVCVIIVITGFMILLNGIYSPLTFLALNLVCQCTYNAMQTLYVYMAHNHHN